MRTAKVLSKIVLYLIIPCVILNAFQVDYTPETVRGLLVAFAASLLMQVVLLFLRFQLLDGCFIWMRLR